MNKYYNELPPKEVKAGTGKFLGKIKGSSGSGTTNLGRFQKTVVDYIAWETGFPVEFLEKPEKFWNAYNKLLNRGKDFFDK